MALDCLPSLPATVGPMPCSSVGPTTTDAKGGYTFDNLPALPDGQSYTVAIDQEASKTALAPYVPTTPGQGDRAGDSSTWSASSQGLTKDGDRDPTLDFGFVNKPNPPVVKTYAIGDKVWIDKNRNGVQDGGEKPLVGVKVELLDGSGKVVATTTTDSNGRYVFDSLPAGAYQVKFVLTAAQATKYTFTNTNKGGVGTDSDASKRTGLTKVFTLGDTDTNLTTSYPYRSIKASQGIDPTWDAGVVLANSKTGGNGGDSGSGGVLPSTGSAISRSLLLLMFLLLGGGALLIARSRRRS